MFFTKIGFQLKIITLFIAMKGIPWQRKADYQLLLVITKIVFQMKMITLIDWLKETLDKENVTESNEMVLQEI